MSILTAYRVAEEIKKEKDRHKKKMEELRRKKKAAGISFGRR